MRKFIFGLVCAIACLYGAVANAAVTSEMSVGKLRVEGAINKNNITVLEEDSNLDILAAKGTSVPADASSGYAKGCVFYDTDVATGISGMYVNIGTNTSCKFRVAGNHVISVTSATAIATTGVTSYYTIAPESGRVSSVKFSGSANVNSTANDYITFTLVNLGQGGAGNTNLLGTTATTKTTDIGTLTADAVEDLTLTGTATSLDVVKGDRLKFVATVTGTLSAAVTFPTYLVTYGGP